METFHIVVLSIAAILLIILLTFVGILMGSQKNSQTFPPEQYNCPDYWQIYNDDTPSDPKTSTVKSGKCIIPPASSGLNCGNIYSGTTLISEITSNTPGFSSKKQPDGSTINYIDFNDPGWAGGICTKRTWATKPIVQVQWDGVSNYNSC